MRLDSVVAHIDEHFSETVKELTRFCRQESVSADGRGIESMASMVEEALEEIGAKTTVHRQEGRCPLIVGQLPSSSARQIVLYNHYDVQPPEPLDAWDANPFEPVIRDGYFFARGAADNKGALVARLAALRAFKAVHGQAPVGVTFIIEGEEESGSPMLREFIPRNPHLLQADGLIWEEASADQSGTPVMRLGNKGMLHLEIRATGPRADIHSRFAGIMPNPIWRLVWALASIRDANGKVAIDGFANEVVPPTEDEQAIYRRMAGGTNALLARNGLEAAFPSMDANEAMETLYHEPTCNIPGMAGGYTGPGTKGVLPAVATARLEFRLVPNQDPERVAALLLEHLKTNGFGDLDVRVLNSLPPSKTPMNHPFARLVYEAGETAFGCPLVIEPSSSGSGPRHVFTSVAEIPIVAIGVSHAGSAIHGPNENIQLCGMRGHAIHVAALMYALSMDANGRRA